jgi:hypothetical protein
MYDLTKLSFKRVTWDDVLTSDSLIRVMLHVPTISYDELPSDKVWSPHPNMMFGGYYVSRDGDCYMPF